MAILPLSHSLALGQPFCDYLNVTSPLENQDLILRQIRPILDLVGASEVSQGLYQIGKQRSTFKLHKRGSVAIMGASGSFLDALRKADLFGDYLSALASFPHRVSMLHAAQDYAVPDPSAVVHAVKQSALDGALAFTRKAIQSKDVSWVFGCNQFNQETGTVYLGNKANHDVWGKVYDKQHERISRGFQDPGKVIRVEIAVQSDIGATLRDAHSPVSLYHHFASKTLVERSPDVPEWVANGEGYVIPKKSLSALPMERLYQIANNSLDLGRLVQTAVDLFGDEAPDVLSTLIRRKANQVLSPLAA